MLLADEPTGAVDTATGEEVGALLAELNAAGQTLILVTHNPDLAARYAHRVVELADGRIRLEHRTAREWAVVRAVVRAARGGLGGRRLQAVIIGLVALASTAASTLALGHAGRRQQPVRPRVRGAARRQGDRDRGPHRGDAGAARGDVPAPGVTAAGPFLVAAVTAQVTVPGMRGSSPSRCRSRAGPPPAAR